jgi:hypothetical protein
MDNMLFVQTIVIAPEFLSAEPLASNVIAVTTKGEVDFSTVQVTLNNNVSPLVGSLILALTILYARLSQSLEMRRILQSTPLLNPLPT